MNEQTARHLRKELHTLRGALTFNAMRISDVEKELASLERDRKALQTAVDELTEDLRADGEYDAFEAEIAERERRASSTLSARTPV